MACPKCGESYYWSPKTGCIVCKREQTKERFVITLTDEEFATLSDRNQRLVNELVCRHGNVELIIQRAGE